MTDRELDAIVAEKVMGASTLPRRHADMLYTVSGHGIPILFQCARCPAKGGSIDSMPEFCVPDPVPLYATSELSRTPKSSLCSASLIRRTAAPAPSSGAGR